MLSCARVFILSILALPFSAQAQFNDGEKYWISDIFVPKSAPAQAIYEIAWLVSVICLLIFFVVGGLLAFVVVKFRKKADDDGKEPPQVYGSNQIEIAWTVIPVLICLVLILVTARVIGQIQDHKLPEGALEVRVVGHQWWWEFHYEGKGVVTANELHIPLSKEGERRPVRLLLQSADVVHSFWVPQLAGKTDVIPNRTNELWLEPWQTGTYFGNCAEYCGTQHANMLIRVIVHEEEEFEKWLAHQASPPVDDPAVAKGRDMFLSTSCINCHRVGGTIADGVFGPDLTHLMSRQTIGAGVAPLTPENLEKWVHDPQDLKVGCLMPDMQLTDYQVKAITAYLLTLK